jgi:hypothetical protein
MSAAAERAHETIAKLKLGTWESVESAAILVTASPEHPASRQLLAAAEGAAGRLKAGSWESVRALAWLAKARTQLD